MADDSKKVRSRGRPKKVFHNDGEEQEQVKRRKKRLVVEADQEEKDHEVDHDTFTQDVALEKGKQKWETLAHNGILFPPEYKPHGVPLLYDGFEVKLSPEAEEVASMFAKHLHGEHAKNPIFVKNFFAAFKSLLDDTMPGGHPVQDFASCDFGLISLMLKEQAAEKAAARKLNKDAEAEAKATQKATYGFAVVNGRSEPLANFQVEPPSLFLGRGEHPKAGMLKERIYPEHVILNIGPGSPIPPCPLEGHQWGSVVSDPNGAWIARWPDSISGSYKYVRFSYSSSLGGASDRKKYEKARMLKKHISAIRAKYTSELDAESVAIKQRATVMWMLDKLALRVGNEKNLQETADTVGCCSLRVEHITLHAPSSIELDFLGKDSMRYTKTVQVPRAVYRNMKAFIKNKKPSDQLFEHVEPGALNAHLKLLMPGLTAKVFRTFNASTTLQEQLNLFAKVFGGEPGKVDVKLSDIRLFYNRANRQVAVLCNHQKSVSKTHVQQIDQIDDRVASMRDQIAALEAHAAALEDGTIVATKKRKRGTSEDDEQTPVEGETKERRMPNTLEAVQKKIAKIELAIHNLESVKQDKGEGATIQNSTSKINYMDPRITARFCKRSGLPLSKVFPTTLLNRFAWAIAEIEDDPDFLF